MRICYVADFGTKVSGGHQSLLNVIEEEIKRGVEPIMVCHKDWELLELARQRGIKTFVIPGMLTVYPLEQINALARIKCMVKHAYNRLQLNKAVKFFKENQIDLIHFNSLLSCPLLAIAAQKCGVKYIWHIREFLHEDHNQGFPDDKFMYGIIRKADYILAISKAVQSKWSRVLERDVELVYNGLPLKNNLIERETLLDKKQINIVLVGRILAGKGQMDAVRAMDVLKEDADHEYHLRLVGYRGINPYEIEVKKYIDEHDLSSEIELTDFTYELSDIRKGCDIGLVCSKAEAFGRVTIEYMLSGLYVIGTNSGGTAELIDDRTDGALYEVGDYRMLAEKIKWAADNPARAAEMAKIAQQKALDNYVIEKCAENIYRYYGKCLSERNAD